MSFVSLNYVNEIKIMSKTSQFQLNPLKVTYHICFIIYIYLDIVKHAYILSISRHTLEAHAPNFFLAGISPDNLRDPALESSLYMYTLQEITWLQ